MSEGIRKKILIFILVIIPSLVFTSEVNYYLNKPYKINGVIKSRINCMIQDSVGYLWIGTMDGLYRYDGSEVIRYVNYEDTVSSLPDNKVFALYENSEGNILIGTQKKGICVYNRKNDTFEIFGELSAFSKISHKYVKTINEDSDGNIWVGTMGGGINRINKRTGEIKYYFSEIKDENSFYTSFITASFVDSTGDLWIGTYGNGLFKYSPEDNGFTNMNPAENKDVYSAEFITSIDEDISGTLRIGSNGSGVSGFDLQGNSLFDLKYNPEKPFSIKSNSISCIESDDYGNLWIGTSGGGLNLLGENGQLIVFNSENNKEITSDFITAILIGRDGLLWFSTIDGEIFNIDFKIGVFNFCNSDKVENTAKRNSDTENVTSIDFDYENKLWIGTDRGKVSVLEKNSGRISDVLSISEKAVKKIKRESENVLWIATLGAGLIRYDLKTDEKIVYDESKGLGSDYIFDFYIDGNGFVWVGTGKGLYIIDFKNDKEKIENVPQKLYIKGYPMSFNIICLFADKSENLWIGTDRGIDIINTESMSDVRKYLLGVDATRSLSSDNVNCIYQDSLGRIWIASTSGLRMYIPEIRSFRHFTEKDGLPDNNIQNILEDSDGKLWLSTNDDICKFEPDSGFVKVFGNNEGLKDVFFYFNCSAVSREGELFFGSSNGVMSFFPDDITLPVLMPDIYIENLTVTSQSENEKKIFNNLSNSSEESIVLDSSDFFFEITFKALEYRQPENIAFSYRLYPFQEKWVFSGNRNYVSYTKMEPGEYIFQVRNSDAEGKWNDDYATVKIKILPPFWKTTQFIIIIIIIIFFTFFFWYFRQTQNARKLESLVKEKTMQLKLVNEKLKIQSETDGLTEIYNHKFIMEQLKKEVIRINRKGGELCILMMDIDHFKKINDKYGHQFGDNVLKEVADIMKNSVRESDYVGRYGGEEFMIILTDTSVDIAFKVAERIRINIHELSSKFNALISISGGITDYKGGAIEDFIHRADFNLYVAKEKGRNRIISELTDFVN